MNQKISGRHFDKRLFKTVCFAVFEQPVKFRCFQRIVGMSCKTVFRTEVAQGCVSGSIGHKKASRVVKHREAMIIGRKRIIVGSKI
jgi:hypothetical protein